MQSRRPLAFIFCTVTLDKGLPWTGWDQNWRKRVGVEPTKNRLTALSGFEGQPPHRERFSSVSMIAQNRRVVMVARQPTI